MSLPPSEIPLGAMRFNSDSQKLEYWNGSAWFQINTFSPNLNGGVRAIMFGGNNGSSVTDINFFTISTQGDATDFGDLPAIRTAAMSCASSTRGFCASGQEPGAFTADIDFVTIASTGDSTDFGGNVTDDRDFGAGLANATRGVFVAGRITAPNVGSNLIDFITMASSGDAKDFGDIRTISENYPMCLASPTRGIIAGGVSGTAHKEIDFITIASTGNGQDFGDLNTVQGGVGASNSIRGIFAGGYGGQPTITNIIEFATIATRGNATNFGDLTQARRGLAGASSSVRACFAGGSSPTNRTTIDYVAIATLGDAADFGDLIGDARKNLAGCSNGHGGLG